MGLFSRPQKTYECKLCGKEFVEEFFIPDLGLCRLCGNEAAIYLEKYFVPCLAEFEEKANQTDDPDSKINFLIAMLNILYEYKFKYQNSDVKLIDVDIQEQIDQIIDCISHARET